MDVDELVGSFVVECGVRQAWPFLGFCDNQGDKSGETRLYVDTAWSVGDQQGGPEDAERWLLAVARLDGLTVSGAQVQEGGLLRLELGGTILLVSGDITSAHVSEPWWLAPWR